MSHLRDETGREKQPVRNAVRVSPVKDLESQAMAFSEGGPLVLTEGAPKTLAEALVRTARTQKGKGIIYIQPDGSVAVQTYASLLEGARSLLAGLYAIGLKPHDRVILHVEDLNDHLTLFWACILGGIAPVTVAVAPSYREVNSIVHKLYNAWELLDHPVILTAGHLVGPISGLLALFSADGLKIASVEELRNHPPTEPIHQSESHDLVFFQLTSGSTGIPKCIQETHRGIVAHIHGSKQLNGYVSDDVSLNWLPMDHVVPILTYHLKDVYLGCQQVQIRTDLILSDPLKWLDLIEAYGVTHTWSPNFGFKLVSDRLAQVGGRNWDLSSIKAFMNAGEQVTFPVVRDFLELVAPFGVPHQAMQPAFGMAEVCTCMTYRNQFDVNSGVHRILKSSLGGMLKEADTEDVTTISFVDLGPPMPGVQIRIVNANNNLLREGVIGRLQIKGDIVTPGYLNNDSANREAFVGDGWFDTGDLGFILGGCLTLTGREKEMIIVRGANFYCYEIEDVVNRVDGVEPTFVAACGVDDPKTGTEGLAIFFVPETETPEGNLKLIRSIRTKVASHFGITPSYVVPLTKDVFPRTTSGKIQRGQLKKALVTGSLQEVLQKIEIQQQDANSLGDQTQLEEQLASIWTDVLRVNRVGIHDNFFELGGDSLLATQVISRSRDAFQVELPLHSIFEAATVAALAKKLEAAIQAGVRLPATRIPPVPRGGELLLSFVQQRLWFLDQFDPGLPNYNIPIAARIEGRLDTVALEQSLQEIVRRHEALRTCFRSLAGSPVQVIVPFLSVAVPVIDLRNLPESEREIQALRLLREEASRPFDLAQGPLFRLMVLRLGEEEHLLFLSMHHIASDGWSVGVLFRELRALYAASSGSASPLSELPLQYPDFANWQRHWLRGEVLDAQLAYWKQRLAGSLPGLELPTDHPRPPVQTFPGARKSFALTESLTVALRALSRREGVTLFMTLLAALQTLLHRITGQEDLLVGSPIANRSRTEIEGLIGSFANTLVLRTDLSGDPTFRALLRRVREVTLGAYAHPDLPFEKLVEEVNPPRDLSRSPLFQVMFVFQNAPLPSLELPGLVVTPIELDSGTANFELTLSVVEGATGLRGWLEYNTDLFDAPTITRMVGHFQTLLEGIVVNPGQRLSRLQLSPTTQPPRPRIEWIDTRADYPRDLSIQQLFEAQVERTPDAVAVVFERQQLTYTQLNRKANQVAHHLQRLGVSPEVRVGICVERSLEMLVGLLGILKAGGAYLPLDPELPKDRLNWMLTHAQAPVLLTQQHLVQALPQQGAYLLCMDSGWPAIGCEVETNPVHDGMANHLAYLIYTSGSTGQPKGVEIAHQALVNFLHSMNQKLGLRKQDTLLAITTFSFDIAALELFLPLMVGARLVIARREIARDGIELVAQLVRSGATVMQATPATWRLLIAAGWEGSPGLTILCGGEALLCELAQQLLRRCAALWNLYGPTETTIWSTVARIEAADGPISIGLPIANTQLYLLDRDLQPVPIGVPGELYIGGVGLARGYLNQPEVTAAKFIPDPFGKEPGARLYKTGDLARYWPDGRVEFLGRLDHQVKLRGYRIELEEIEATLAKHPAVREHVVLVREDKPSEKRLIAYIVADPAQAPTSHELRHFLKAKLPEYMVPSAFMLLDALPLTPNGKVDRKALPAPHLAWPSLKEAFVAPTAPVELAVALLWAEILGLKEVGTNDDFFQLGGHSLLAIQVISRLRDIFQIELPLRSLFEARTVGGFARVITEHELKPGQTEKIARILNSNDDPELFESRLEEEGIVVGRRPAISSNINLGERPVSIPQERLWFLDQLEPGQLWSHYNEWLAVRLAGRLDVPTLQRSLTEIVRRHEALRTGFRCVNGTPVQVIAAAQPMTLPVVDLRNLAEDEREAHALRLATEETHQPFDLAQCGLVRSKLLCLAEEQHILLVVANHIVSDGWSMSVLFHELGALYQAFSMGRLSPLPELPSQYADFALWQREWHQGEAYEEQLSYWRQKLAGAPTVLELPTDRPRTAIQSYRGARQSRLLPHSLYAALQRVSRHEGVTLFMTLLAAFQTVVYGYTGQEDLLLGFPVANRNRTEFEGLIGLLSNLLVLRTNFSRDSSFRTLLAQVREVALDAYAHQDLRIERLVDKLLPERDLNHQPLVQVMFGVQNAPMPALELPGLTLSRLQVDGRRTRVDLTLFVEETQGLTATAEYCTDLFESATITRLLDHFQVLLESIVVNPEQRLSQLVEGHPCGTSMGRQKPRSGQSRATLPRSDRTGPTLEKPFVGPRTTVEEVVAQIWSKVLGFDQVGIHHNFFDVGGHSLLATQVISRISDAFHIELPLRTLFEKPTIEQLALVITERQIEKARQKDLLRILTEVEAFSDEDAQRLLSSESPSW
jgi:amino acid adenylation domain-containing protein